MQEVIFVPVRSQVGETQQNNGSVRNASPARTENEVPLSKAHLLSSSVYSGLHNYLDTSSLCITP